MPAGYVTDSDDEADQLEIASDDESEISGALQSANYRVYSTWELYERMIKKTINVNPPYQRDVVWTSKSQSALIDSIFKNKWVPTLLFSERPAAVTPDGVKVKPHWVCMDGKQRLTSIKLFIDGEIPWYKKPKEPIYYTQSHPPHPSRRLLDESLKDIFLSRGITAAMYTQLNELQERDIFRLVQEGKPLSTGEKLQASSGIWGRYIGDLTEQYMTNNQNKPNGWAKRISNLTRGADYYAMAQVVLMIRDIPTRAPEPPRNMTNAAITKEIEKLAKVAVPNKIKEQVKTILDIFMEVSTLAPPRTQYTIELRTPDALFLPIQKGRKTMLAPVEMIWIPYMIFLHHSQLSKGKLLEMIELFKLDMRRRWFNEVKNNSQVNPWIVEWIRKFDIGRLKGKYAGWAVPRPPPQLLSQDNSKPDISGMHEYAQRNSSTQASTKTQVSSSLGRSATSASSKRDSPSLLSQDKTNSDTSGMHQYAQRNTSTRASTKTNVSSSLGRSATNSSAPASAKRGAPSSTPSPADLADLYLKRQRRSVEGMDASQSSQQVSQPTASCTSRLGSVQPANIMSGHSNAQSTLAAQRTNSTMKGSQLSSSISNIPRQAAAFSSTARSVPPPYNHGTVPRPGAVQQTAGTARFVPNYPSASPPYAQRSVQPPMSYSSSATHPPHNASVSYPMNQQLLHRSSGYAQHHQ